jgi:hypothetical protein
MGQYDDLVGCVPCLCLRISLICRLQFDVNRLLARSHVVRVDGLQDLGVCGEVSERRAVSEGASSLLHFLLFALNGRGIRKCLLCKCYQSPTQLQSLHNPPQPTVTFWGECGALRW